MCYRPSKTGIAGTLGSLVLGVILAACGGQAAPSPAASSPGGNPGSSAARASAKSSAAASPAGAPAAGSYHPIPLNPPVKLTVGLIGSTSDAGIFIGNEKGYFKDEGIELDIQRFQSLVVEVPLVGTGKLDVGTGALAAGLFNSAARDIPLKIVADKGSTPNPQFDFTALMIRKDLIDSGKVKDYKDLKGLSLATSQRANSPEVALAAALGKGGLTLNDIHYVNMGFPDMVPAFANKSIDGAIVIEPFASRIAAAGTGVRWKGNVDLVGNQQIAVIVYSPGLLKKPDVAQRWMNAYVRGLRDYNDAFGPKKQGRDEVIKILAKNTAVKDPKVYDQMRPAGLDPDGKLDLKSLQRDLGYYEKANEIKGSVSLDNIVDTTYQQKAAKALGPYKA
ncbi:MAG: ABC transporter substrate-binding protein [Chloroflexota bacterium]|nr:ABC transporter substrate-binding protein [Chloroflexota bacterium]